MAEDGYSTSHWNPGDADTQTGHTGYGRALADPAQVRETPDPTTVLPPPSKSSTPPTRSSAENSFGRTLPSSWNDNTSTDQTDSASTVVTEASLAEPSFDESVLRALCDMDCSVPLLLDRIKQSLASCKEVSQFFKKRAVVEEEYGKNLQKLVQTTANLYSLGDGKAGTFVQAWQSSLRIHERMAENRLKFSQRLNEMGDELAVLIKEVEKNKKLTKELATRYERALQDAEAATEKSKNRLDLSSEELERVLLVKEGESIKESAVRAPTSGTGKRAIGKAVAKGGLLLKGKNPGNILRQEDDIRTRVSNASDAYRKSVTETQTMRQEYFNFQLPRILRALKESVDEVDLGTQYHLTRYAFLFESIILSDGSILVPPSVFDDGNGLKATFESIDNRSDFKVFMQNYAFARGNTSTRGPRREGPEDQGFLPLLRNQVDKELVALTNGSSNPANPEKNRTFGVDLAEQMARDNVDVPPIVEKCCRAIEKYGMSVQGIYRLSGTLSKVQKLKERLDRDLDSVNFDADEWTSDINNVTGALKLWLRELPDPLLTFSLHQEFIEAAKIENDRLRRIRLHERVNSLPDPNYATLKYFLGHLHRINQSEAVNSMSVQNLAIVFGPTLFGSPTNGQGNSNASMLDAGHQNKAIETILEHYADIFVDEAEGN